MLGSGPGTENMSQKMKIWSNHKFCIYPTRTWIAYNKPLQLQHRLLAVTFQWVMVKSIVTYDSSVVAFRKWPNEPFSQKLFSKWCLSNITWSASSFQTCICHLAWTLAVSSSSSTYKAVIFECSLSDFLIRYSISPLIIAPFHSIPVEYVL